MKQQQLHIEEDIEERIEMHWDFKPSDGGVRNQNYIVLSIVAPEGTNQRTPTTFGIKFYGAFATQQEAVSHSKKLQQECDTFDYFVMDALEWVKLPPEVARIDDQEFQEDEMEKLRKGLIGMRKNRAKLLEKRLIDARKDAKKASLAALEGDEAKDVEEEVVDDDNSI
jgi:hypothetical protein